MGELEQAVSLVLHLAACFSMVLCVALLQGPSAVNMGCSALFHPASPSACGISAAAVHTDGWVCAVREVVDLTQSPNLLFRGQISLLCYKRDNSVGH